jgi:hypothetical protein
MSVARRSIPATLASAAGVSCYRQIVIDPNTRARTYEGVVHLRSTKGRLACGLTASYLPDASRPPVTCKHCLRRPEARQ